MKKTWLSRRINGITMQGEPTKDKKSGVKPYITYDPNDPRIQAYSDSLNVYNQYQHKIQPDLKESTSWDSKAAEEEHQKLSEKAGAYFDYIYGELNPKLQENNKYINKKYKPQLDNFKASKGVEGGAYENTFDKMSTERRSLNKPVYDEIKNRAAEVKEDETAIKQRMKYLHSSHVKTTNNQINFDFDKPDSSFNVNGMKPVSWDKTVVEGDPYYTGMYSVVDNKYGRTFGKKIEGTGSYVKGSDFVTYSPNFKKPTQKVILREKGIEKMPIGKLKSKSSMPEKLKGRQNMKMLEQTVMGTSGKREVALSYQKRKRLTDKQMYATFPGLDPNKAKW
jgi:hypothetical protein